MLFTSGGVFIYDYLLSLKLPTTTLLKLYILHEKVYSWRIASSSSNNNFKKDRNMQGSNRLLREILINVEKVNGSRAGKDYSV